MAKSEVAINDMRFLKVDVTLSKMFWLRAWCAKALLLLAARVAKCDIEIRVS